MSDLPDSRPFLKWAGGKTKSLTIIAQHLPKRFGRYHEPFVGGGALFFHLAAAGRLAGHGAQLSDANTRLVRTYRALRDRADVVIERLKFHASAHCKAHYYETRAIDVDKLDDVTVAAWLIYLNRTCFNGLYRVNRKGGFNTPMGRYDNPTICDEPRLRAASWALAGVDVGHGDFLSYLYGADPGDLVYCDPPYVPLSETADFTGYTDTRFGIADQQALVEAASKRIDDGVHLLLSNHDSPKVRQLYGDSSRFELVAVRVPRAINSDGKKRGDVGELLIVGKTQ